MSSMFGMPMGSEDEMKARLDSQTEIIEEVNAQFKNPVIRLPCNPRK